MRLVANCKVAVVKRFFDLGWGEVDPEQEIEEIDPEQEIPLTGVRTFLLTSKRMIMY